MKRRNLVLATAWLVAGLAFGAGASSDDSRLAIKGYDPVAYFTEGRPAFGSPRFESEWDGAIYRFVSTYHLELFNADAERYLPQFGNFCTAALSRGEVVVADPEHWLIHDGRLYIFGRPIGPGLMQEDPAGMAARADEHRSLLPDG